MKCEWGYFICVGFGRELVSSPDGVSEDEAVPPLPLFRYITADIVLLGIGCVVSRMEKRLYDFLLYCKAFCEKLV